MKTAYLLTLTQEGYSEPIGKILLSDNNLALVIKGLNKIEKSQDDYYESYAKDIRVYGALDNLTEGIYKDTVRWADMSWDIEQIDILY